MSVDIKSPPCVCAVLCSCECVCVVFLESVQMRFRLPTLSAVLEDATQVYIKSPCVCVFARSVVFL